MTVAPAAATRGNRSVTPDPIVALLRELVAEVRGLREDVKEFRQIGRNTLPHKAALSREDRSILARLLPAIGGTLGSEEFLARDLFEHPSPALRLVRRGLSAQRIGLLFQRAEGQVVDGYVIERAGDELHTNLWRIMEVAGSGLPSTPPRDPAARA